MPLAVDVLERVPGIGAEDPVLRPIGLSGTALTLRRAWPRASDRLTLEYTGGKHVVAGEWRAGRVRLYPIGADRRLPALRPALQRPGARLVSHRAGRRAVVAIDGAYVKALRPGSVATVARAHEVAAGAPGVAVPAVRHADDARGILELSALPGRSLHDLLASDEDGTESLRTVGAAIRRFHDGCPAAGAVGHGAAAEQRVLAGWLERLQPFAPHLHAELAELAGPTSAALAALRAVPDAALHRDLHDKQVLLDDGGGVGVIDLDTLTVGDPAVDLANLAAHLQLRALQAGRSPETSEPLRAALLEGYGERPGLRDRMEAYECASLLRLACVYAFRPRRPELPGLLASAAARAVCA